MSNFAFIKNIQLSNLPNLKYMINYPLLQSIFNLKIYSLVRKIKL